MVGAWVLEGDVRARHTEMTVVEHYTEIDLNFPDLRASLDTVVL